VLQLTSSEMVTIDMNLQMNVRVQVEKHAVIGNLSSCQVLLADPGPVKTWGCEVGPATTLHPQTMLGARQWPCSRDQRSIIADDGYTAHEIG
jgi:hypothetical protein